MFNYTGDHRRGSYTHKINGRVINAFVSDQKASQYWQMGDFFHSYVNLMMKDYKFEGSFNVPYCDNPDFLFDYFLAGESLEYLDSEPSVAVYLRLDWEIHWKMYILPSLKTYKNVDKFIKVIQKDAWLSSDMKSYIWEVLYRAGNMALCNGLSKIDIQPFAQSVRRAHYGKLYDAFCKTIGNVLVKDIRQEVFHYLG